MTDTTDISSAGRIEPFFRGVIGAVVLLLITRAAEPLFFGDGYYASLAIHPYWLVIILAATQYGSFAGVLTAAAAALLMEWPQRPTGIDITDHYVELAVLPVQWLLVAIVIGTFRQGQIRREMALAEENAHLRRVGEDLAAEIDRMDGEIAALELAAATRPAKFASSEASVAEPTGTEDTHANNRGADTGTSPVRQRNKLKFLKPSTRVADAEAGEQAVLFGNSSMQ